MIVIVTMDLASLLKPSPFVSRKVGESGYPEQLLANFMENKKTFKEFLLVTNVAGEHTEDHTNRNGGKKAKAMLKLVGGKDMVVLFEHVGGVTDGDSYEGAINKIATGI